MNTIIDAYLQASRITKKPQEQYESIKDLYNNIYSNIITFLKSQTHPQLVLCFTLQKSCEQVRISNDTDFLVYDVSISNFMRDLNTLLLSRDTNQFQIECFIHRYFAEANYSHDKDLKALFHKRRYNELNSQDAKRTDDLKQLEVSLTMTLFQIVFIFLHELSHYNLSNLTKSEYVLTIQAARNQLLQQDAVILMHDQKEFISDVINENSFKYEPDFLALLKTDGFWEQYYERKMSFYSQDENIEEILCDTYALKNMLSMGYSIFPESLRSSLKHFQNKLPTLICHACYIGLQNLNVLSYIEKIVVRADIRKSSERLSFLDFIPGAQERKRCFVDTIISLMTDGNPKDLVNKERTSFWLKFLRDTDDRYDRIMNVIFEQENIGIVNIIQSVFEHLDKLFSDCPESEWESRLQGEFSEIENM